MKIEIRVEIQNLTASDTEIYEGSAIKNGNTITFFDNKNVKNTIIIDTNNIEIIRDNEISNISLLLSKEISSCIYYVKELKKELVIATKTKEFKNDKDIEIIYELDDGQQSTFKFKLEVKNGH